MPRSLLRGRPEYPVRVDLETDPPQPEAVVDAIRAASTPERAEPDPWWQAGIDDALAPFGE